jgi:hypothetical protein
VSSPAPWASSRVLAKRWLSDRLMIEAIARACTMVGAEPSMLIGIPLV